jgi:hypothetical protein
MTGFSGSTGCGEEKLGLALLRLFLSAPSVILSILSILPILLSRQFRAAIE